MKELFVTIRYVALMIAGYLASKGVINSDSVEGEAAFWGGIAVLVAASAWGVIEKYIDGDKIKQVQDALKTKPDGRIGPITIQKAKEAGKSLSMLILAAGMAILVTGCETLDKAGYDRFVQGFIDHNADTHGTTAGVTYRIIASDNAKGRLQGTFRASVSGGKTYLKPIAD